MPCETSIQPFDVLRVGQSGAATPPSTLSLDCEGIYQLTESHEFSSSTVRATEVDTISNITSSDDPKHRCRRCQRGYRRKTDLRRHEKGHNPDAFTWKCGCCQNRGEKFESTRKDKIRDHIRSSHPKQDNSQKLKSESPEEPCPVKECPVNTCDTLLRANSCVIEHLSQEHCGQSWEPPYEAPNGQ